MKLPFSSSGEDGIDRHGTTPVTGMDSKYDVAVEARAVQEVKMVGKTHRFDPNLPDEAIDALHEAAQTNNIEKAMEVEKTFLNDSPYESVRAAVRPTDGEEVANTLRAWILGFIFVTLSAAINMLLSMRSPAIVIPTVVIMLLVFPVGRFCARVLPSKRFNTFGVEWTLNPGPFNIKEHAVVTLMASVT